ncbi:MAG: hypothetical protein WCI89_03410 [bacterium]
MTEAKPVSLLSTIAAEVLLGKIRLSSHQGEPNYLQPVRNVLMQIKRKLGQEGFTTLSEDIRPAVHALADLIFDEVTGVSPRDKTVEKLKALPVPHRLFVENIANGLTGKLSQRNDRWMDELWSLKGYIERVCATSVSDISPEEIREGFDDMLHGIVDNFCDRRTALTS